MQIAAVDYNTTDPAGYSPLYFKLAKLLRQEGFGDLQSFRTIDERIDIFYTHAKHGRLMQATGWYEVMLSDKLMCQVDMDTATEVDHS